MGGGRTKSEATNVHNDNDVMASDNAVVVAENGSYSIVEDNEGLIIGDGSDINTGLQIGHGSSYNVTTMDDNTAGLLEQSMTLLYANTENVLESYAAGQGWIDSPEFMNPEITHIGEQDLKPEPMSKGNKAALGGAAFLLLALAISRRNSQS